MAGNRSWPRFRMISSWPFIHSVSAPQQIPWHYNVKSAWETRGEVPDNTSRSCPLSSRRRTLMSDAANSSEFKGGYSMFPEIVDASHATPKAAEFFHSFFTAKSRHDVDGTMNHFSKTTLTYIDATLGRPLYRYDALKDVFVQYMPKWPPSTLSYPTLVLGDEHSALVAMTDTPELFGG